MYLIALLKYVFSVLVTSVTIFCIIITYSKLTNTSIKIRSLTRGNSESLVYFIVYGGTHEQRGPFIESALPIAKKIDSKFRISFIKTNPNVAFNLNPCQVFVQVWNQKEISEEAVVFLVNSTVIVNGDFNIEKLINGNSDLIAVALVSNITLPGKRLEKTFVIAPHLFGAKAYTLYKACQSMENSGFSFATTLDLYVKSHQYETQVFALSNNFPTLPLFYSNVKNDYLGLVIP